MNYKAPTLSTMETLQTAFDHFNEHLFEGTLPPVMITLQRKRNARGYFHPEQFKHREDGSTLHEIAMHPDTMDRHVHLVLSTLAHEAAHLWDQEHGKPAKNGGHSLSWGRKMDEIGLTPTSTGEPGGKRTGRKVTHMIVPDGPFDIAVQKLNLPLDYFTVTAAAKPKKPKDKLVSCCPDCGQKAWSKPGTRLICGNCDVEMAQEEVE